jgi:3-oxoacyl-(acyl-carrier-protein) synthase/aryl carrier-like protein
VYWITGGLGGLGMAFARHLGQRPGRRIILSGRSALDGRGSALMNQLLTAGIQAQYLPCDLGDPASVAATFQAIKAGHGVLHGVLHGAGLRRDGFLLGKTLDDVEQVFAAKVGGTIALDEVTKSEPLDLFVLFSSLAAVNGNLGQADYASANAFMDSYAHYRNHLVRQGARAGRSLTINWPLWRDGGMHVDPQLEAMVLRKTGFIPITNDDGIEIFHAALRGAPDQLAAFRKQGDQAARMLGIQERPAPSGPGLLGELTKIVSDLLKLEPKDLEGDVNLADYGLDSIQMMSLLNILEETYQTTFDPNTIVMYPTLGQLAAHLAQEGIQPRGGGAEQARHALRPTSDQEASAALTSVPAPGRQGEKVSRRSRFSQAAGGEGVAIIGYAARFPGAPDSERYWQLLRDAQAAISTVPRTRWRLPEFYDPRKDQPNKSYSKYGAFLAGIANFAPEFFKISPADAALIDPQQRIALELTQHLLDQAGYDPEEVAGERTSLFLGAKESTFSQKYRHLVPVDRQKNLLTYSLANMIAGRIANFYDIRGPVTTVDTACSSSLVAIRNAMTSLRLGESDLAIAGGVCLMTDASGHVSFSQAQVLSDDDKSCVFDREAKGFVLGEGAGLVMLKRSEDARRDGDSIFAIIRGGAVNNDGYTMGLTVPNKDAQKAVIRAALEDAKVDPSSISYLEAHGTGTLLGDPIEIRAATELFQEFTDERAFCAVGSVKSNIGHAITAAGVASLLKVVLSLRHERIPATLNCREPHPRFGFPTSPFFPNVSLRDWRPRQGVRRAGISSFGFGGTNAHLVVEGPPGEAGEGRRRERPLTRFEQRAYWPDPAELEEAEPPDYRQILARLSRKDISLDHAIAMAARSPV